MFFAVCTEMRRRRRGGVVEAVKRVADASIETFSFWFNRFSKKYIPLYIVLKGIYV